MTVSGIDTADSADDDITAFSMCVADNGVVTDFEGTYKSGKKDGITLQKYSTSVDSSAFQVPAGATITDLSAPPTDQPTDQPTATDTGDPSDSPSPAPSAS